ncbi:MAG: hypothetical protein P8010_11635 [Desulfosarcinaceae bacterium]|jgi:hypothetical protein
MIETGQIGQNRFLMAEALDIRAGIVGAFQDQALGRAPHLRHAPLLNMPVGYAR